MGLFEIPRNLRIVVFDFAQRTWADKGTQELFSKIISLKLGGYGKEYADGVLPLDSTELIGTHLAICSEGGTGELEPLVAYRSVTLSRCKHFNIPFPATSILESSNAPTDRLSEIIRSAEERGAELAYSGSWTMRQDLRENRDLSKFLRQLVTTIGVQYHMDYEVPEWVTIGIKRFKTNEYFEWMGLRAFVDHFEFYSSANEPAAMLHLKNYSPEAIRVAKEHESYWLDHIFIGGENADAA